MTLLAIFISLFLLYSLLSRWLERTMLTAPILFTAAGMAMSPVLPVLKRTGLDENIYLRIAEAGLVLLLFTDASRTHLKLLRSLENLAARLLSTGLLLTILLGALVAKLVFPQLSIWEAGILGAI